MKLKKLISAVISAAMLCTMAVMPVRAEETSWELDNGAVTHKTIAPVTNVGGGKEEDDYVLSYTDECYIRLNTTTNLSSDKMLQVPAADMTGYTGYMVVSMNVMSPVDTQKVSITTNSGTIIMANNSGGAINVNSDNGFTANRWNNVVCLIRLDNGSTTSLQTTYVNGTQISERAHKLFSSGKTEVRLNATGTGDMYIDDVKVQFTTEAPDITAITAMPVLSGVDTKAVVNGSALDVTGTVKVSELAAVNSNVTVFESVSFKNVLATEARLETGNVAVAYGDNGKMSYYTVNSTDVWTLNNETVTKNITTVVTETNVGGGKSASESALKYTVDTYIRLNTDYNIDSAYILKAPQEDMSGYTGYMIVSMNVMSPVETQSIFMSTSGGYYVMSNDAGGKIDITSTNGFTANRWNNVVTVVSLDGTSTTDTNGTATTYVNGELKFTRTGHQLFNYHDASSIKTDIRLNAGGTGDVYFDDVKVKFTTEAPDIAAITAMPVLSGVDTKATVSGNEFGFTKAVTAGELSGDVRVFEDSTLTNTLSLTDTIEEGNMIVVTDDYGKMNYYTVRNLAEWTLDNTSVTTSDPISAVTNVGGGKSAEDDVLKYTGSTYIRLNTTNNLSEDKMLKAPLSDMSVYTGYMIVSMNVMSPVETQYIGITTSGGPYVMGNDAGGKIGITSTNGFTANRWNNVVTVVSLDGTSTTDTNGTATTYVNGELKFTRKEHQLFNYHNESSIKTDIRLNAVGTGDVYFDDVKVQFTTEEPDIAAITAMPEKPAVGYDITLAQAKEQGATRVYSQNTLAVTDELSDEDIVKHGYAVAKEVVDENGYTKYSYSYAGRGDGVLFTLKDSGYSNNKTVAFNGRTENGAFDWSTTGLGGKASDDMSAKMTFVPSGSNPSNGESTYLYFDYVREEDGTYDYMIFDYNVFIPEETAENFGNVGMASNGGSSLGGWFGTGVLKVGAWNNIVSVLKFNDDAAPTYTSYVNGKLTAEGTANSRFVTENVPQIRLVFNAYNLETDANLEREEQLYLYEGFSAYADDIKIYGSSTPYVPQESLVDEVMNESYAITDNADGLYTKTMTVDAAKALVTAKYSAADVKVLRDGAEVTEGNIAVGDAIWYKPYADKELYGRLVVKSGAAIINDNGTINAAYYEQEAKVIIAEYSSAAELDTVVLGDNAASYTVKNTANPVSVMVWSDFKTCEPLCQKIDISFK